MANKIINDDIDSDEFESKEIFAILFKRLNEISFILLIAIVVFFIISLASYHKTDPAWSYSSTNSEVRNAAGIVGAYSADLLLSIFGYLGYFLPIMIIGVLAICFKGYDYKSTLLFFLTKLIGAILVLLCGCTLANLHIPIVVNILPETSGGITGSFVQQYIVMWIGEIGATLVLTSLFMAGVTFLTGLSWLKLTDITIKLIVISFIAIKNLLIMIFKDICEGVFKTINYICKLTCVMLKYFVQKLKIVFPKFASFFSSVFFKLFNIKIFSKTSNKDLITPIMEVENNNKNKVNNQIFNENDECELNSDSISKKKNGFGSLLISMFASKSSSSKDSKSNLSKDSLNNFSDNNYTNNFNSFNDSHYSTNNFSDKQNLNTKNNPKGNMIQDNDLRRDNINSSKIISGNLNSQNKDNISCNNADTKAINNLGTYNVNKLPTEELLEVATQLPAKSQFANGFLENLSRDVESKLADFGAEVRVVGVYPGPVITRFEIELKAGLKVSKISSLAKDLARSLSVTSLRVIEVIPGKSYVGLEIPNKQREIVKLREIVESDVYKDAKSPLTLALGKDIAGAPVIANLTKMPHLLVAGTTGSGKSVGVNAMLLSILYKSTPDDVRLILIDPKMLELSIYESIPHLLAPVVTDMKDAANALNWCVEEMERRYRLMAAVGVRNLTGFNEKIAKAIKLKRPIPDPLWHPIEGEKHPSLEKLPYIVVIIDEFADMMMVVGKKVEELIARIAQKARAAGIHMILATQRPSVDVITGIIKANIPTRIAFQVSSKIDSRTILDQMGAEQLLGNGDMLYLPSGAGIPIRVHGAFVSDQEVHNVVGFLKEKSAPQYVTEICSNKLLTNPFAFNQSTFSSSFSQEQLDMNDVDELYQDAVIIVAETRKASISYIQRRLKIGFNRAARLLETMESEGIISAMKSNGTREVLVDPPINDEEASS